MEADAQPLPQPAQLLYNKNALQPPLPTLQQGLRKPVPQQLQLLLHHKLPLVPVYSVRWQALLRKYASVQREKGSDGNIEVLP